MTKQQTKMYFDVDLFKTWLCEKKSSLTFESKNKITNAVELAKLNAKIIPQLEAEIAQFLDDSLKGPTPAA